MYCMNNTMMVDYCVYSFIWTTSTQDPCFMGLFYVKLTLMNIDNNFLSTQMNTLNACWLMTLCTHARRCLWHKIHFDVIEGDVWHCTPKKFDRKYFQSYRIIFLAFEYLLQELTPFICPFTIQIVKTPLLLRKAVKMVLYQLAHGISFERMSALYNVDAIIIRKYTYIVCDVLSNGDKLFSTYVHIPIGDPLLNIIEQFHDMTS